MEMKQSKLLWLSGVATTLILMIGLLMAYNANSKHALENFDEIWGQLSYPDKVEKRLFELLPEAQKLPNKSIYLQMLSQIALAQALQRKFEDAHKTLDQAEELLTPEYELAHTRILLERGRTFQQAGDLAQARHYFEQSFELGKQHGFDKHTINAAHMIAIVAPGTQEKIAWNERAINMALESKKDGQMWLGSLYNNLGQNFLDAHEYEKALKAFTEALEYRKKENVAPNIRLAQWAVAHTLRLLQRDDEALDILEKLRGAYDQILKTNTLDMPKEAIDWAYGWVLEDMAEIYHARAKKYAQMSYKALSKDQAMFKERLQRLQDIIKS